jgi:hypothetical protein
MGIADFRAFSGLLKNPRLLNLQSGGELRWRQNIVGIYDGRDGRGRHLVGNWLW